MKDANLVWEKNNNKKDPIWWYMLKNSWENKLTQINYKMKEIESSNLCENTRACLDPNFKITARLFLL